MMRLCAACRNTSMSRTTGVAGIGTVGLEDPYGPRGADTVAVQENHDFPHRLLFGPGPEDTGGTNRPDTINLA
jgi:hypothetical protein